MDETNSGLSEEQCLLDELSRSIGLTLDPHATCRDFLTQLATRLPIARASVWWLDQDAPAHPAERLTLLEAYPETPPEPGCLPLAHPFWQRTRNGGIAFPAPHETSFLIPLDDQGVLVLYPASASAIAPRQIERLCDAFKRLSTTLRGAIAHARLQKFETELRETSRHLAEAKKSADQYAAQLARTNSHLHTLIHTLPDLVWLKDRDGVFLDCNSRFELLLGVGKEEIIGRTDYDFYDRDQADFFRKHDRIAAENGCPTVNEEWNTFASDGHREWLETTKTPMYDSEGSFIGVLGIGHDITDRKQAEETLRMTEERSRHLASMLRLMCDNVPDMIWAKDLDNRYLFANKALCEQILNSDDIKEPLRKTDLFFAQRERRRHPDNPDWHTFGELCQDSDAITLKRGEPSYFEEYGNVKGRHICLEVRKSPFRNEEGEIIGTVGSARDITDRKKIEAELERHRLHLEELVEERTNALIETEARASHILHAAADGLYGVGVDGRVTFINPAASRMLGYRAEEVIGQCAHSLFHHSRADGTHVPRAQCPGYHALASGAEFRVDDEVYWHSDGHPIPVMYAIHPYVQNGKTTGAVVSFVDISEQRAAAQAREKALAAAENLARIKSEFLSNMSHEIRTPLNGVLGFAQIGYRHFQDSDKTFMAFEKILSSGKRLLDVVNDVLDFSKIEDGKLCIEQREVNLAEVIDDAIDLVKDRARSKRLDLRLFMAPDLPKACLGDPFRLRQILLNLLTNAIKFTEEGEVLLTVSREADSLVFSVRDTGIGISEEQLSILFNPSQQVDGSATRRFDGTGLGLAIGKRLLELMDGEISVESQPGIGSCFEFRIPCRIPHAPLAETTHGETIRVMFPNKPLLGVSILIVENDDISQMVLEHNLVEDGADVVMVSSGREAVERMIQDGPDTYDVVLMDIMMSDMDGYEATQRILELAPDLPIIGQTAHAFDEERERCLAAGMAAHIPKPIDPESLVEVVLKLLSTQTDRVS